MNTIKYAVFLYSIIKYSMNIFAGNITCKKKDNNLDYMNIVYISIGPSTGGWVDSVFLMFSSLYLCMYVVCAPS